MYSYNAIKEVKSLITFCSVRSIFALKYKISVSEGKALSKINLLS